jgi:glycosyltransferase involved in cell wall biosynthesis
MSSAIFISVIIPNYNHYRFLEARIKSILNQSYQNFEIIILDDFSNDNSKDIIEKFKDNPKISHVVYNDVNSGSTFIQWNKGLKLAKGDWLWIAESDDTSNENFLLKMIESVDGNDHVGISYCQSLSIDELDKVWGDCLMWTDDLDSNLWKRNFTLNGKDVLEKYLIIKNIIPNASACLINKKALLDTEIATLKMKFCGDWYLWCQILLKYDLAYVSEPLNYFRFHNSTTRTFSDTNKFLTKLDEDCRIIFLISTKIQISKTIFSLSLKKLEDDVYTYFKDRRQILISLKEFRSIFSKYGFRITVSLINIYLFYFKSLWNKIK